MGEIHDRPTNPVAPSSGTMGYCHFEERSYTARERVTIAVLDGVMAVLRALVRLGGQPMRRAITVGLGDLLHLLLRGRQRVILTNFDLAFGDELTEDEKRALARRVWRHSVRAGLDFFFADVYWPREKLARSVVPHGTEVLDELREYGKGFAVLAGHVGPWELGMRVINDAGYPTFGIYKGFSSAWFDHFMARKRLEGGFGLVEVPRTSYAEGGEKREVERASLRGELQAIWSANQGIAIGMDQYARRGGKNIAFLGVPDTPTPVGALRYAIETGVPLTFQSCAYTDDDRIEWTVHGPIYIEEQPGGTEATIEHYARMANDWISAEVRRHRDQYMWGHRRFARHYYERERPVRRDEPTA